MQNDFDFVIEFQRLLYFFVVNWAFAVYAFTVVFLQYPIMKC